MIVALHAATGAATGVLTRSRSVALAVGPLLHVVGDRIPHRHPAHSAWEYVAGLAAIATLARRRGVLDAATLGAVAAMMPDLEHLFPAMRFRGAKTFHRRKGGDRTDASGISVRTQTVLALLILAPLSLRARTTRAGTAFGHEPVGEADGLAFLTPS